MEWRQEHEPEASYEELSYLNPASLYPSHYTKTPHTLIFLVVAELRRK
jgi:hypothetical protein